MSDTEKPGQGMADELTAEEAALFSADGSEAADPAPAADVPAEPKPEAPVEAPVEAPTGEELDEDETPVELAGNAGRYIRHGAFHRERKMRQAAEKREAEGNTALAKLRDTQSRLDERLRLLADVSDQEEDRARPVGKPAGKPDPLENPFEYMQYLGQQVENLGQTTQQATERTQAQDDYSSAQGAFVADARAYAAKQPDFANAYSHVINSRDRELQRVGVTDQARRQQIIQNEEFQIVSQALSQGVSPSQMFYEIAGDRGYRKADPAPAAVAPAAKQPTAVERVQAIKGGQESSRSLGSAAGGSTNVLTSEMLANMPEAEFDKAVRGMSREQKKALFGG